MNHLLLVLRDRLARIDVRGARRAQVVRVESAARAADDRPLDALVEAAADLVGPLSGSVWLLTDDVVAREVELEARTVRGLDARRIGTLLALEMQAETGLAPAECVTEFREQGGGSLRRFRVVQARRGDLELVEAVVRELGGRLRGVGHPAGLPTSITGRRGDPFVREEAWPDGRVVVERVGDGAFTVADARAGARDAAARPDEVLSARFVGAPGDLAAQDDAFDAETPDASAATGAEVVRFDRSEDLSAWARAWVRCLARGAKDAPVLHAPRRPLPRAVPAIVGTAAACAVAAWCWFDRAEVVARRDAVSAELREHSARVAAQSDAKRRLRELVAQLEREREPREPVAGTRWDAATAARLLETLARERPGGVVVHALDLGWQRSSVSGVAVNAADLDALVVALADELSESGYHVGRRSSAREDGCVDFELFVEPRREQRVVADPSDGWQS